MSLEELREQNIRLVTVKALECFIKNGINNTRVSEIAAESGLTQRSVFRYFPSKDDIVIAAAFCYWERTKAYIARELRRHTDDAQTGIEQINIILNSYANMLFVDPEGIRFSLDAEVALYSVGKNGARYQQTAGALRGVQRPPVTGGTPRTCGRDGRSWREHQAAVLQRLRFHPRHDAAPDRRRAERQRA